ncbi:ABC transporter ATP-binding protein, partial [Candidatus Saccharibacteria bacterium]|nr:ABC transporter ATP-binding protein [Candidatus Saccharibacteria bacterium]
MSQNIAISVNNVSKTFKLPHEKADSVKSLFVNPFNKNRNKFELQHALRDISFDIPKGEFFGIVGRNGSGKSTLLKIIAGIYRPNKGSVKVHGRLVPFIELGVGFNPELTGRENAYLNGALMGFSEKEVDGKYKAIVDFAELERFMDQKLKNYSSGMQVRLAFSVATVLAESDVLLIDEVLAVGDADFQRKCFEYFKKLKKDKKTVIFVSHDMNAIREYCDRAVLIEKSKIVFEGTSEQTAKEYTRLFLPDQYEAQKHQENKASNKGKWGLGGASIESIEFEKNVLTEVDKNLKV